MSLQYMKRFSGFPYRYESLITTPTIPHIHIMVPTTLQNSFSPTFPDKMDDIFSIPVRRTPNQPTVGAQVYNKSL